MKNIVYTTLCLIITACLNDDKPKVINSNFSEIIDFSDALSEDTIGRIYNLVDSICLIQLETTSESVLSGITGLVLSDNRIFVRDLYNGGSVAIFDRSGKYLKRIPSGEGPGELNHPSVIAYDQENRELTVYQPYCFKKFTDDGELLMAVSVDYVIHSLISLSNGRGYLASEIFNDGYSSCRISWIDSDFKILKQVSLIGKYSYRIETYALNYDSNLNISFSRWLDNNIYTISGDEIEVSKVIEMGDKEAICDDIEHQVDYAAYPREKGKFSNNGGYCETRNYEIYHFDSYDQRCYYRHKKTGKLIGGKQPIPWDSSVVDEPVLYCGVSGNFFVSLLEYVNCNFSDNYYYNLEGNKKILSPEQMEMLKNLTDEINPIIMLYSLKDPE